jgi:hypothetical protein
MANTLQENSDLVDAIDMSIIFLEGKERESKIKPIVNICYTHPVWAGMKNSTKY